MNHSRIQRFGDILQKIPFETWDEIVLLDPECQYIGPYRSQYHFGGFASLMVMLALNSYQLKGKAEMNYWYAVDKHLSTFSPPKTRDELQQILIPFYENERLPTGKLKRINRFFSSSFAEELWTTSSNQILNDFSKYWIELSRTMNQQRTAKTICFAMKCLGISVFLTNKHTIKFTPIPIPVDSRVISFTKMMKFTSHHTHKHIQCIWDEVLDVIQKRFPTVSMIHLDSLIWQIGTLNEKELESYFHNLQLTELNEEVMKFKLD